MAVRPYNPGKFPGELLRISTYLFEEATYHEREVYNLLDLIGEMGGIMDFIYIGSAILLYHMQKQSFILYASSQLFKART